MDKGRNRGRIGTGIVDGCHPLLAVQRLNLTQVLVLSVGVFRLILFCGVPQVLVIIARLLNNSSWEVDLPKSRSCERKSG